MQAPPGALWRLAVAPKDRFKRAMQVLRSDGFRAAKNVIFPTRGSLFDSFNRLEFPDAYRDLLDFQEESDPSQWQIRSDQEYEGTSEAQVQIIEQEIPFRSPSEPTNIINSKRHISRLYFTAQKTF